MAVERGGTSRPAPPLGPPGIDLEGTCEGVAHA